MQKDIVGRTMEEYEQQCELYSAFTEKAETLVGELLEEKGLPVHSITSRVKEEPSLRNKLHRFEGKYSKLDDVTDVAGIRIITHYVDDVDAVAAAIEEEFDIDTTASVDKGALLDPDRFGYLSLHYVAKLAPARLQLTEYQRFSDCKVEIQIRSILQHAWAEIEHELGYKSRQAVPREIRRRLSRLTAILELADEEFALLRIGLTNYEEDVPQRISAAPQLVGIDQASLVAFVKSSRRVKELNRRIASAVGAKLVTSAEHVSSLIHNLRYVGLNSIADVDTLLQEFGDVAARLAELMIRKTMHLTDAIGLWYLCYVLVARSGSAEEVLDYLKANDIGIPDERKLDAERIISSYKQATGE